MEPLESGLSALREVGAAHQRFEQPEARGVVGFAAGETGLAVHAQARHADVRIGTRPFSLWSSGGADGCQRGGRSDRTRAEP